MSVVSIPACMVDDTGHPFTLLLAHVEMVNAGCGEPACMYAVGLNATASVLLIT